MSHDQEVLVLNKMNSGLEEYRKRGAHVMAPMTIQTIPPMHKPVLVAVTIDIKPESKEVYPQKGGGVSLTSLAWKKLADAIGIQWVTEECRRLDNGQDPNRCEYRMVGRIKALDGTWRKLMADKEIRMEIIQEELRDNYRLKAQDILDDPKGGPQFKLAYPDANVWVEEKVRVDALQIKKHILARTQTGALARCIKSIGIRETYTKDELAKPFVFPKLVPELDQNNPDDRAYLRAQAAGAIDQLYRPAERASAPPQAVVLADVSEAFPEQTDVGFRPQPTSQPTPPAASTGTSGAPSPDELLRGDFTSADARGQKEVLVGLMKRKGYGGKVTGDIAAWTSQQRSGFFDRLLGMPDVVSAGPVSDALPFD